MRATIAAATAALVGSTTAATLHHRHEAFHALAKKNPTNGTEVCGCTTIYSTYYGEPTLVFPPAPPPPASTSECTEGEVPPASTEAPPASTEVPPPANTEAPPPTTYEQTVIVVPTPIAHQPTTTGVVTFPPTTVTLTEETTVCVPQTTSVTQGTNIIGGVTTIVETATTVTCPYPVVETSEGVTTSVVRTTEYVCPTPGTYTIAPTTTVVDVPTDVVIPSVTNYPPGTYTAPEVVTTITNTETVVYCPFEPAIPTTEAPQPTSPPTEVPEVPKVPEVPSISVEIPSVSVDIPEVPTLIPEKPKSTEYPTSDAPKPKPTGGLGGEAGLPWGTTYTPYYPESGLCMSKEDVTRDIAALAAKGIKVLRTYSTDCNTLEFVGEAAEQYGIDLMVGIFVGSPGCSPSKSEIAEQITAFKKWAKWDMVKLFVVGNEAIINGYCSAQEIGTLIETCKQEFPEYSGPFTTAETVNIWEETETQAALCGAVDVIGTNAHAFFNSGTSPSQAGKFVKGQLDIVSKICPGKEGYVLETGWPSQGKSDGSAIAGFVEQAIAIKSIIKECGDKSVLFSLHDDMWKDPNTACACEQHCEFPRHPFKHISKSLTNPFYRGYRQGP